MRAALLLAAALCALAVTLCSAAPQSKLQVSSHDADGKPFIEEVVVESVLHVKSPTSSARQSRTNMQTSLRDGARVAETKNN